MRSGGALAGGGPEPVLSSVEVGVGVKVAAGVGVEVGEDAAVEVGDMVLEVIENAAIGVLSTVVEVGAMVAVGGKGVRVKGMGVAEGVAVTISSASSPFHWGEEKRGGCACMSR